MFLRCSEKVDRKPPQLSPLSPGQLQFPAFSRGNGQEQMMKNFPKWHQKKLSLLPSQGAKPQHGKGGNSQPV